MKQLHSYSTYNLLAHSCFMTMCDYMTSYTRCIMTTISISINPIRSGLFQTANDPGGALKAPPPPPTITKTTVSIFTISYMCILPGVLDMFQLEFFKNSRF